MEKTTFGVLGMACGHCKMAVEKALKGVAGVAEAAVDLGAANVTVTYDASKTNVNELKAVVTDAGYEPQ